MAVANKYLRVPASRPPVVFAKGTIEFGCSRFSSGCVLLHTYREEITNYGRDRYVANQNRKQQSTTKAQLQYSGCADLTQHKLRC
jgi:hypothetical protein